MLQAPATGKGLAFSLLAEQSPALVKNRAGFTMETERSTFRRSYPPLTNMESCAGPFYRTKVDRATGQLPCLFGGVYAGSVDSDLVLVATAGMKGSHVKASSACCRHRKSLEHVHAFLLI